MAMWRSRDYAGLMSWAYDRPKAVMIIAEFAAAAGLTLELP